MQGRPLTSTLNLMSTRFWLRNTSYTNLVSESESSSINLVTHVRFTAAWLDLFVVPSRSRHPPTRGHNPHQ